MVTVPPSLDVHLYGVHVARVTRAGTARLPGRLHWEWTDAAARQWGEGSRVVSHGLPVRGDAKGLDARATVFMDGLLPEGELRTRRAIDLGLDPDDTYALMHRCGVDTAGALTVTASGDAPQAPADAGAALDNAEIARRLVDAGAGRYRGQLTSISLAGMVPKIGVVRDADGAWRLPGPGQASTWIIKQGHPAESLAADVIDTEALCLDLGRRCGVTDVECEILNLGDMRAIGVRRYDRLPEGHRIHQEDLAQALGLATADPERKFQRGRALPSWSHAAQVLRAGGGLLSPLARLVAFSFLVGDTDHHAKNTSFLRYENGEVGLAPAYDIGAHLHHRGSHRFALDIAGRRDVEDVTVLHVIDEIASWGVDRDRAVAAVVDVVTDLRVALGDVDRGRHPGVSKTAWGLLDSRLDDAERLLAAALA